MINAARRPRKPAAGTLVLVVGLVIGVLIMHGLGDPSMDHSRIAMGQTSMVEQSADVAHHDDRPSVPAGEMAVAAVCAFAVLRIVERVTRRSPQPVPWRPQLVAMKMRLLAGPEPPVPKPF